ncbi:unnamed protein product [marine sediment metagenome]|uniref:Uncharacterized protein n=1 Tax=marine sediment metagenome TaxID=412755 RepID=X1BDK5_9ZZZZ
MKWLLTQLPHFCRLDNLAKVHDSDIISQILHHRKIMRDKKIGQTKFLFELLQEVYNLRLN